MTDRCCPELKPVFDSLVCNKAPAKLNCILSQHYMNSGLENRGKSKYLAVKSRAETHCRQKCITRDPKKTREQVRGNEKHYFFNLILIDLVTVFDATLTSRQTSEKLQCLYGNLIIILIMEFI